LSRDYQVLSIDVRGHGKSSPLKRAYSVDGFTRDLEILLQKAARPVSASSWISPHRENMIERLTDFLVKKKGSKGK